MTSDYRFSRLELERQEDANRIHELETEAEELRAERDTWAQACAALYNACKEGGSKGRPMDLIPKREWVEIVNLISIKELAKGH